MSLEGKIQRKIPVSEHALTVIFFPKGFADGVLIHELSPASGRCACGWDYVPSESNGYERVESLRSAYWKHIGDVLKGGNHDDVQKNKIRLCRPALPGQL